MSFLYCIYTYIHRTQGFKNLAQDSSERQLRWWIQGYRWIRRSRSSDSWSGSPSPAFLILSSSWNTPITFFFSFLPMTHKWHSSILTSWVYHFALPIFTVPPSPLSSLPLALSFPPSLLPPYLSSFRVNVFFTLPCICLTFQGLKLAEAWPQLLSYASTQSDKSISICTPS